MKFVIWSNKWSTWDFCASVVRSNYLRELDEESLPIALVKPNDQTLHIFLKAQLWLPTIQTELEEWSHISLLNHSASKASIPNTEKYIIDEIIDCHPLDISLQYNIEARTWQVWSTSTVIAEIFIDKVFIPEINYLILLLSWIVCDTNNFTDTNSTERDEEAYHRLKELVNIEHLDEYIQELLEKTP